MIVREDHERHYAAVRQLHIEAFPTPAEADLVEQLRRTGDAVISLAAFDGERVVGHAMFSAMRAVQGAWPRSGFGRIGQAQAGRGRRADQPRDRVGARRTLGRHFFTRQSGLLFTFRFQRRRGV
jgi:putative acetyltransferase